MIRNIIAVLIEIGNDSRDISDMKKLLDAKSRKGNLKCAFSGGLYLEKVNY
jgi:tRNA U38,U39,U40 pseudouridine synthase TruA